MAQDQGGSGGGTTETAAERNARILAAFNQASNQAPPSMPTTTAPDVPNTYDVRDIQGRQQTSFRAPHLDVPYDQWKANEDVQRPWDWIEKPLRYDTTIQRTPDYIPPGTPGDPLGIGGTMTPGEANAAGWGGVSQAYWREDADSMALMKAGQTPLYGADLAALATANYINNFGYPSFITPYVANKFGWSDEYMEDELGYIQTADGHWVRTTRGTPTTTYSGGGGGGYYGGGGGGYYGGGSGYAGSSYIGLVNWRIGL